MNCMADVWEFVESWKCKYFFSWTFAIVTLWKSQECKLCLVLSQDMMGEALQSIQCVQGFVSKLWSGRWNQAEERSVAALCCLNISEYCLNDDISWFHMIFIIFSWFFVFEHSGHLGTSFEHLVYRTQLQPQKLVDLKASVIEWVHTKMR